MSAAALAGRLVLIQGEVSVRPASSGVWQPARLQQELFIGDAVRTGPNSKAALLSQDESQIKLNENTVLVLKKVVPSRRLSPGEPVPAAAPGLPETSVYQVLQGEIWLRNIKEEFLFELETPTVTATIRGTEFTVQVRPDGATNLVLLEGSLKLTNAFGEIWLKPGEESFTRQGEAPTKRLLVSPEDAVQWSLYYPGFFSYRDLPLAALESPEALSGASVALPLVRQGMAAFDQGRLAEARDAAQGALARNPNDAGALTLAGWVSLARGEPEEALDYFRRLPRPGPAAIIGAALARYRLGDVVGACFLIKACGIPPHRVPLLSVMEGYFAMLLGKAQEARVLFAEAAAGPSPAAQLLARCYLAQMNLVQNRREAAAAEARRALALNPASPLALLSQALVDIASFQLAEARRHLKEALAADPEFVDASVYLARLHLGADELRQARRVMEETLSRARRDANVLALAGFVALAFRNYPEARDLFLKATAISPRLGDPHLGLSVCHFRDRRFPEGLAEMLTAGLNVNQLLWKTAPAATELEQVTLGWLRQWIGLPEEFFGILHDTASTATLHAILAAREQAAPEIRLRGEVPKLTLYASEHAHSSVEKGALAAGAGLNHIRHVPSDAQFRMRVDALEETRLNERPFLEAAAHLA